MPPDWKLVLVLGLLFNLKGLLTSQHMQDAISMTADGWRPIVGQRRPYQNQEVSVYKNPQTDKNIKVVVSTPATKLVKPTENARQQPVLQPPGHATHNGHSLNAGNQNQAYKKNVGKLAGKGNNHNQYITMQHGPVIPLNNQNIPRPGQIKKYPGKPLLVTNGKRIKPIRGQAVAHSQREEIYLPAPGHFGFVNQGSNIKTRETGLGLLGNHFSSSQNAQFDLGNRFSGHDFGFFGNSPGFAFNKHPQINDVHFQNDEYTRNLVPPPLYNKAFLDKEKAKKKHKEAIAVTEVSDQYLKQTVPLPPPSFEQKFVLGQNDVRKEPVEVEISKQRLKVFHNSIPANYNPQAEYVDYDYHTLKKPSEPKPPTYEVTEGKFQDQVFNLRFPETQQRVPIRTKKPQFNRPPVVEPLVELNLPPFLPTPYRPEGVVPTSPTQSEVSTVFTALSNKIRKQNSQPLYFDVKEVSTHYPIFGKPEVRPEVQTEVNLPLQDISNEITTSTGQQDLQLVKDVDVTTTRSRDHVRTRVNQRRRKPGSRHRFSTTTEEATTESYESQKVEEPVQRRRPNRYRTTTTESAEIENQTQKPRKNRYRNRQPDEGKNIYRKRIKPEMPVNHKITEVDFDGARPTTETENYPTIIATNSEASSMNYGEVEQHFVDSGRYETELTVQKPEQENQNQEEVTDSKVLITELLPATNVHLPENEIDYSSTIPAVIEGSEDVAQTTLATTIPPVTTTEPPTTSIKSHRIRTRPNKYDNSNRPRFSVKEYRQRLNQYSSTSTTTETPRSTESHRVRFPSRGRRPTASTSSLSPILSESDTTESTRTRFKPKEPRYGSTTETSEAIITDKAVKSVNTRLRPFGRYRSTTEAPKEKISIRPNLFSQRRRHPQLSLKSRINQRNNTESATEPEETTTEETQTTESLRKIDESTESSLTTTEDILKNDAVMYSQRVSDLTSSFTNDHKAPGVFKSVAPTSRRIPNYFTISTDDPILPIEAFFPNIKDRDKDKDHKE